MPRDRLAAALLLPPSVAAEIDGLRRALGADVDHVPPHLTLVPPVNVRHEQLDDAHDLLRSAAAAASPLRLELGPPVTFLPDNPVLYLAVGGDVDGVVALRDSVFRPPLARPLSWPFVPHVTLLETGTEDRLRAAALALGAFRAEAVVTHVHLLRELRDADGRRRWRPIADAALAPPVVVGRGGLELELAVSETISGDARRFADQTWHDVDVERYGPDFRKERLAVVARRSGVVVGVAEGDTRPDTGEAYLKNLVVAADIRGQGVGRQLVAAFGSAAAERDATYLTLRTEAGGPAEGFYEAAGFRRWYVLPEWRAGRDWVQLRRPL